MAGEGSSGTLIRLHSIVKKPHGDMVKKYIVAVDCGTTGSKAGLLFIEFLSTSKINFKI